MSTIKKNDFRCMWQGKIVRDLKASDFQGLNTVERIGEKTDKALLMVHGFSSTPAVFRELIPHLNHYDAIFAPALPGHAQSVEAFSKVRANDWLQFITDIGQNIAQTYAKVDVVGLSMGGVLACHLSQHIHLNHLYLLAPALFLRQKMHSIQLLAHGLSRLGFKYVRNLAGNLHSHRHCEMAYRTLPLTSVLEVLNLIQQLDLKSPNCPVDVFLGKHDAVVHSEMVASLVSQWSDTTIHWLNHSAHVLPLDGDIDQILALINEQSMA